jgi:hypothetical protein
MDTNEKRRAKRKPFQEDVFLELTTLNDEGDYVDKVVPCETVDLSRIGLKLYVNQAIVSGTVLDLCVNFKAEQRKFFLTAEVKWVQPLVDDGWYFVGFELYEAENTDYELWCAWIDAQVAKARV